MPLTIRESENYTPSPTLGLRMSKSEQFSGQSLNIRDTNIVSNIYFRSNGYTSSFGFTTGSLITKDMIINSSGFSWPSGFFPSGSISSTRTGSAWPDWGDDIFDTGWGYFYFYDPTLSQYYFFTLNTVNQADGVIVSQSNSFGARTFTIKHGYPVRGIYRFDISVNDSDPFIFGGYGNMGSDTGTRNSNKSASFAIDDESFTLYYNHNSQSGVPLESFYSYFVPYEKDKNKNVRTYTAGIAGSDYLSIYSVSASYGINVYFSKRNDVKDWVINDLKLSSL